MTYNMNSVNGNNDQIEKKDISLSVIENVANQVFQEIGSGQNENIYREAMLYEFRLRKYDVSGEVSVPVKYKDVYLSYVHGRIDILLEKEVILELKTIASSDLFGAVQQCKSYMKYLNKTKGYVINFPKTDRGKLVVQEITTTEMHGDQNIIKYMHSISLEIQKNNKNFELILEKLETLEKSIHDICEGVNKTKIISKKDNIVLLIEETSSSLKLDEETEGETDLETDDDPDEVEVVVKKDKVKVIKEEKIKLEVINETLEEDDTEIEIVEKENDKQEIIDLEEEVEEEQEEEEEEQEEEEEEEEEEQEEEEQEEEQEEEEQEEEQVEQEEEEEEEELFEIEIENVTYCTNNEDNGIIYELEKDGNVGKQIGYLKDGEAIFT